MALQHGSISSSGLRIHYLHEGDRGEPLLLLHGGGTDSAMLSWGEMISPLAASRRVFAPDWPGYGDSDRPDSQYTMAYYISVLGDLIQALGLHRPTLIGVSMGGGIALGFALDHPQAVDKLVLVDSYGLQDRAPAHGLSWLFVRLPLVNELTWALTARSRWLARASLAGIFRDPGRLSKGLVDAVYAELSKPGAGAAFRSFQKDEVQWRGLRTVYMDRLHELQAPTLFVHGAQDTLVPLRFAREAHARVPGSRLEVIADAGHWPQREQPAQFLQAVSSFLGEEIVYAG
jgi:pimeloyl-ACP methyl ester carboxylesterase